MQLHFITQEVLDQMPIATELLPWLAIMFVLGLILVGIAFLVRDGDLLSLFGIACMGIGAIFGFSIYVSSTGYEKTDPVRHYIERHSHLSNAIFYDCVTRDTCFPTSMGNWQPLPESVKNLIKY